MRVLLTGGTGRLGTELRRLLPEIIAPPRQDLDITRIETVYETLETYQPDVIVHAAAHTDVKKAEQEKQLCWQVNVEGTRNITRAAQLQERILVHISTDYVFAGVQGPYKEDDPLGPPINYYALSKIVAEEMARFCERHLIIRTSFRPREWPYPVAFNDVYTSQDYVDVIAPEIGEAIQRIEQIPFDTLHIATERKSVLELARRRRPEVEAASKKTAGVNIPDDVSLDITRWETLKQKWEAGQASEQKS